jgi:hypothetical protein
MLGRLTLRDNISTEEVNRLVDEAIAQHQASILALRAQRNDFAYISRLPPEILCRILSFAQKNRIGEVLPFWYWIPLTHVNRHWRHVGLNSSSLWNQPSLANLQWLKESLSRSKNSGLDIHGLGRKELPGLKLALKHSSHIKHLHIFSIPGLEEWNKIQKALPKSAPRLESLLLEGNGPKRYHTAPNITQYSDAISISNKVLCDTKRLRRLWLTGCMINWDSHPLLRCPLTHLTMHNLLERPSWKQFLDAMKAMPDLEHLDVKNAFPKGHTSPSHLRSLDHIHFARLQNLSICSTEHIHEVKTFFQFVSFPPAAMVKVECSSKQSSSTNYSGIISGLGRSYPTKFSSGGYFQTLIMSQPYFNNSGSTRIRMKLFMGAFADEAMICHIDDLHPTLELEINIFWDQPSERPLVIEDLLNNILHGALPLQDIRHVYLDCLGLEFDSRTLANTFGRLPQVESLIAGRNAGRRFINALKLCSNTNNAGSTYFPALSSICFFYLRITNSECEKTEKNVQNPSAIPIELLQDGLNHCRECGIQVEKLTLIQCRGLEQPDTRKLLEEIRPMVDLARVNKRMFFCAYQDSDTDTDTEEEAEGEL